MLIGIVVLMLTIWTAYFVWVFTVYLPNKRQQDHRHHQHQRNGNTNIVQP
jgi:hypothetical protein